jgi:hypothetical protein
MTILQQLRDAERAGRDAGWTAPFRRRYQQVCNEARAAGFVLHRDVENGRVSCTECRTAAWGTLCVAPQEHDRQQACDSRCRAVCERHARAE